MDNVLGMSVPFAAVIILTSIGSKRDKIIRFLGCACYTTCDATQYRDAGPLTPRHKGAVCGDDDTLSTFMGQENVTLSLTKAYLSFARDKVTALTTHIFLK